MTGKEKDDQKYPFHYTIDYLGVNGTVFRVGEAMAAEYEKPLSIKGLQAIRDKIRLDNGFDAVIFLNIYRHER